MVLALRCTEVHLWFQVSTYEIIIMWEDLSGTLAWSGYVLPCDLSEYVLPSICNASSKLNTSGHLPWY